jgi:hypothetical protein
MGEAMSGWRVSFFGVESKGAAMSGCGPTQAPRPALRMKWVLRPALRRGGAETCATEISRIPRRQSPSTSVATILGWGPSLSLAAPVPPRMASPCPPTAEELVAGAALEGAGTGDPPYAVTAPP